MKILLNNNEELGLYFHFIAWNQFPNKILIKVKTFVNKRIFENFFLSNSNN